MKKLFLIILAGFIFISCSSSAGGDSSGSGSSGNSALYNATDDMFHINTNNYTGKSSVMLNFDVDSKTMWSEVFTCQGSSYGFVGDWKLDANDYTEEVIFKSDGTYSYERNNYYNNTVRRKNGKYELYEKDNTRYIRIFYDDTEYNLKYYISPKYLVAESSNCPVL